MCTLESFLTRVQQRDPHQTEFCSGRPRSYDDHAGLFPEGKPALSRQLSLLETVWLNQSVLFSSASSRVDDRNQVQAARGASGGFPGTR